jgi:hypothetical protein
LVDGRVYRGCEEFVKGHPRNPSSLRECVERFMSCARLAARRMDPGRLQEFVRMVEALEDVKDAGEMVPLLT